MEKRTTKIELFEQWLKFLPLEVQDPHQDRWQDLPAFGWPLPSCPPPTQPPMQPTQGQLGRGVPLKALEGSKRRDLQKQDEVHLRKFPQAVVDATLQGITAKWNQTLKAKKAPRVQDISTAKEVKKAPPAAKPIKSPKAVKPMKAPKATNPCRSLLLASAESDQPEIGFWMVSNVLIWNPT